VEQSVSIEIACDSNGIKPVIHHGDTEFSEEHGVCFWFGKVTIETLFSVADCFKQ